jgi:hypothetical protein
VRPELLFGLAQLRLVLSELRKQDVLNNVWHVFGYIGLEGDVAFIVIDRGGELF